MDVINPTTYEIVASSIIISESGIAKTGHPERIHRTITHEFGHLLGLHHEFDGNPSIMSYNHDETEITQFDIEAVTQLYPYKSLNSN